MNTFTKMSSHINPERLEDESSAEEDDDREFVSADEDEETTGVRPAYSLADMLGALSDEDSEHNDVSMENTGTVGHGEGENKVVDTSCSKEVEVANQEPIIAASKDISNSEGTTVKSMSGADHDDTCENNLESQIPVCNTKDIENDELSQNIPTVDGDDAALEEIGLTPGNVNVSCDSDSQIKITSDISGRFHVAGAEYQNTSDVKNSQEDQVQPAEVSRQTSVVSNTNAIGEHNYENVYDEVATSGGSRGETKTDLDVVKPVLYTTSCTTSSSVSSVVVGRVSNPSKSTTNASVLGACGPSVPSVSDRILSLTAKQKKAGQAERLPLGDRSSVFSGGEGQTSRGEKNVNRCGSDSAFPWEASIRNKSFKTEAVAGADPFVHLKTTPKEESLREGKEANKILLEKVEKRGILHKEEKKASQGRDAAVITQLQKQQKDSWVTIESEASSGCLVPADFGFRDNFVVGPGQSYSEVIGPKKQIRSNIAAGESEEASLKRNDDQASAFDDISYEMPPEIPLRNVPVQSSVQNKEENEADVYCSPDEYLQADNEGHQLNDATTERIYENVGFLNGAERTEEDSIPFPDDDDFDDDGGWSSSEFESFENTPANTLEISGMEKEQLRRSGKHGKPRTTFRSPKSADLQQLPQMLDKMMTRLGDKMDRLGQRLSKQETEDLEDDEGDPVLMDITLNMEKHPPAELPSMPGGLNSLQVKRRHIIASIVESEKNYLDSLKRIVEDYEKPLLELKTPILSKNIIKVIFYKVKDILQCHNMFHIELSESVKTWDEDERIGNVFIASFSKSMVFESYSAYVNNFSVAMETAKKQTKVKGAFAEFLKQNLENSTDKLSLFGLMVKPVQKFPQFILMMQDLLKHTPPDHHDRIPLQMALTELENLTHKLNETKRESEGRFDAKRILSHLSGRSPLKSDDNRYFIRQEDVTHVEIVNGETKTKTRRLYLFSDALICVAVDTKDSDGNEKYRLKWHQPVAEIDVTDASVLPSYKVKTGYGKTIVSPLKAVNLLNPNNAIRRTLRKSLTSEKDKDDLVFPPAGKSAGQQPQNPYRQEVDDMLHDLPLMEHVGQLVSQLRMKYEGLSVNTVTGLIRSLQVNIQQKSDMNKCSIQLTVYHSKGTEPWKYSFQTESSSRRRDWLFELENTKLARDPKNKPGWLISENEQSCNLKLPLFIRPLLIDITRHDTRTSFRKKKYKLKVECAVPVLLPSPELPGIGIQHLWVCSGDKGRGHVTIVSFHGNQPQVVESFKSCESPILCVELVPGYACCDDRNAFVQDTVWMALENQTIQVRSVSEEERGDPLLTFPMQNQVTCMSYLDGRLIVALSDGTLNIFSRDQDGVWQIEHKESVQLDSEPVTDLLVVDHKLWVACGKAVWVLTMTSHYNSRGNRLQVQKVSHSVSHAGETYVQFIVKAGAGLVVSFRGSSLLRLYHLETMEHLQDVNVSSVLSEITEGKKLDGDMRDAFRRVHITCVMACKGLLWIGTSVGCVLTLPLPRLEGVPQIKGRPSVSYRAHLGPVKFLSSVYCGASQLTRPELEDNSVSDIYQHSEISMDDTYLEQSSQSQPELALAGVTDSDTDDYRGFTQSADMPNMLRVPSNDLGTRTASLANSKNLWVSTPDLRNEQLHAADDNIHTLYGSLLKFPQEDYEAELLGFKAHKRKSNIPGLGLVSKKATAVNTRLSQMMSSAKMTTSPQSKYATLPMLMEDCPVYDTMSDATSNSNKNSAIDSESSGTSELETVTPAAAAAATASSSSSSQEANRTASQSQKLSEHRTAHKPMFISQSAPVAMLNNNVLGKSHMVISGGAGQINWNDNKALEMKTNELSLLLWQYKQ